MVMSQLGDPMVRPRLKNSIQEPSLLVGVMETAHIAWLLQISSLQAGSCRQIPKPWDGLQQRTYTTEYRCVVSVTIFLYSLSLHVTYLTMWQGNNSPLPCSRALSAKRLAIRFLYRPRVPKTHHNCNLRQKDLQHHILLRMACSIRGDG